MEALDFHIIWFDGQVCLAMGDVEGARGRALCLGQLVLLLACLALCGSRHWATKPFFFFLIEKLIFVKSQNI